MSGRAQIASHTSRLRAVFLWASAAQSGGDADAPVWTRGAASPDTLKQARADAEYLTKVLDAQRAMREANDPAMHGSEG